MKKSALTIKWKIAKNSKGGINTEVKFTIPYPPKKVPKGQLSKAKFCREYGLNSIYAGKHWTKRKADKDYWHGTVLESLTKLHSFGMFTKPVKITFYWNDGLDCSNHAYMAKMIEDSMKGYIITDDNRRYVKEICHKFYDEPFITVEVTEL